MLFFYMYIVYILFTLGERERERVAGGVMGAHCLSHFPLCPTLHIVLAHMSCVVHFYINTGFTIHALSLNSNLYLINLTAKLPQLNITILPCCHTVCNADCYTTTVPLSHKLPQYLTHNIVPPYHNACHTGPCPIHLCGPPSSYSTFAFTFFLCIVHFVIKTPLEFGMMWLNFNI